MSADETRPDREALHQPQAVVDERMRPVAPEELACRECGRPWPCATVRTLGGDQ